MQMRCSREALGVSTSACFPTFPVGCCAAPCARFAEGEGPSSEVGPVGQLMTSQPDPPDTVECRVMGANAGAVCWLTPNCHGARILNYVIQYRKWVSVKENR